MSTKHASSFPVLALLALTATRCGPCEDPTSLNALTVELSAAPDAVDLGEVPVGGQRVTDVVLRNDGSGPAQVDLTVEPPDGSIDLASSADDVVAAGGSVAVRVRFAPLAPGARAATLRARARSSGQTVTVAFAGTGTAQPLCDDDNECTDDVFDPVLEACVHEPHTRACGDDPCVTDGRCFDGACLGGAASCQSTSPCRVGFCEAGIGCTEIVPEGACDDDDPCRIDTCTDTGCTHATAPDGTPCGGYEECVSLDVCAQGACVAVEIPDGAPCAPFDDACAHATCFDQTCEVTTFETPPAVVAQEFRTGYEAQPVALGDGRWAVVEPAPVADNTFISLFAPGADGELERVATTLLDRECPGPCATAANGVLFLTRLWYGTAYGVFDDDGVFQVLGDTGVQGYQTSAPFAGGALHAALSNVVWIDANDPLTPVVEPLPFGGSRVAVDPLTDTAFAMAPIAVPTDVVRIENTGGALTVIPTALTEVEIRSAAGGAGYLFLGRPADLDAGVPGVVERYVADQALTDPVRWLAPVGYDEPGELRFADGALFSWWRDSAGVLAARLFVRTPADDEWTPLSITSTSDQPRPEVQGGVLALRATTGQTPPTYRATVTEAAPAPELFVTGEAHRLMPTATALIALGTASGSALQIASDGAITWAPARSWGPGISGLGLYRGPTGELVPHGADRFPHHDDVVPLPVPTWSVDEDGARAPLGALSLLIPGWPDDSLPPEEARLAILEDGLVLATDEPRFGPTAPVHLARYDLPPSLDGTAAAAWSLTVEHDTTYHPGLSVHDAGLAAPGEGPGLVFLDADEGQVTHATEDGTSGFGFAMKRDASSVVVLRPGGAERLAIDGDTLVPATSVPLPGVGPPTRAFLLEGDLFVGSLWADLLVIDFSVEPARTWFLALPEAPTAFAERDGRWVVSSPHVVSVVEPPCL